MKKQYRVRSSRCFAADAKSEAGFHIDCFYLDSNRLSGSIPTELGQLTVLTRLDLCKWYDEKDVGETVRL